MATVSFDGIIAELDEVRENPARYVRKLERAKTTPGHARCLCGPQALRLSIRRYGSFFHLAGWPEEGRLHDPKCHFWKDEARAKTDATDPSAAILPTATGLNVRLDVALTPKTAAGRKPEKSTVPTAHGQVRKRAGLLAFLQTLWVRADLNRWGGPTRSRRWGACNEALLNAIGDGPINGQPADEVLHVLRPYTPDQRESINAEIKAFLARIKETQDTSHRGLIIGEIKEITDARYNKVLVLKQNPNRYFIDAALVEYAARTYRHAWPAIGQTHSHVIVALLVERTQKSNLRIVEIAAMLSSAAYIPCDSSHEVTMANRLVNEGRVFEKPMRMAKTDEMLPDFILRDTPLPVDVEVYGMNGHAAYAARKEVKQTARARNGIPCVEWNVDRPLDEVELPSAIRRTWPPQDEPDLPV